MKTKHGIIIGDSRSMKEVKEKSVHLIVTSPPYWQLKDYSCENQIGFDYMGAIIWKKVTTTNTTGGAIIMGSYPYPRNGILKIDYEFILIFKKLGKQEKVDKEKKQKAKLTKKEWNKYFTGHWNFPGVRQNEHDAMFPVELPKRLIKMFTFVNDTVLDPFLGSSTTSLAARNLGRNSMGYEINEEFLTVIKNKLGAEKFTTFEDAMFEFEQQEKHTIDFKFRIKKLPYVYQDNVRIDRKVECQKLQCSKRGDNSDNKRTKKFSVNKVPCPDKLLSDKPVKIHLIGQDVYKNIQFNRFH